MRPKLLWALKDKIETDTETKEKLDIFKRNSSEVKSWKRDLGKMTKKCIKLEKKLLSLEESNSVSSRPDSFSEVSLDEAVSHQLDLEDQVPDSEDHYCSICATKIDVYEPEYFSGELVNPACTSCKDNAAETFSSFPVDGMPSSLASHWLPSTPTENGFVYFNLSSMPSMRSHYIRIPNPGDSFTALEHLLQDYRVFLRRQRQELLEDCRQS